MANYYYITIKSNKVTQEVANEIFKEMVNKNKIRYFDYVEGGHISYNTRGLTDIQHILDAHGITDEEINIEDEFERFYNSLTPEELKKMEEDAKRSKEEEEKHPTINTKRFEF